MIQKLQAEGLSRSRGQSELSQGADELYITQPAVTAQVMSKTERVVVSDDAILASSAMTLLWPSGPRRVPVRR